MIEIVILYLLNKYDSTIYRLTKIIDEFFFGYLKSSTGTINPALKRLESLGCVECTDKMTDGGMLSKTYSITQVGKTHLKEALLSFDVKNPAHILNEVKVVLYCSEFLSLKDYVVFKENILNILELYKIKLEKGLKNDYIALNEMQKQTVEITLEEVEKLIKLL